MYYAPMSEQAENLPFEEVKISPGRIVKIENCKDFSGFYAKITHIPSGILTHKDSPNLTLEKEKSSLLQLEKSKSSFEIDMLDYYNISLICSDNNEITHLLSLPGLIALNIIMKPDETLLDFPKQRYYCVCDLSILNSSKEMILEKLIIEKQEFQIIDSFNDIFTLMLDYKVFAETPELIGTLTEEKAVEMLDRLENETKNIVTLGLSLENKIEDYNEVFIINYY